MNPRPRGSVLLLTLWAMSVLTTLMVAQAGTLGTAARLLERHQDALDAVALAQRGVAQALAGLEADPTRTWDAPSEPWGRRQEQTTPTGTWTVVVADDGGRLNMNTVSPEVLARLPESSAALAAAIVDRRTRRPFAHVAELALVPGITSEHVKSWARLVTVVGDGPVNMNSVSDAVLTMLGLPPSAAQTFVAWRNGSDGELGTTDDHVFHDVADLAPAVGSALKPEETAAMMNLVTTGRLGVRSSTFRVVAMGVSAGRSHTQRTLTALVERQAPGALPQIRGWHED